MFRTIKDSIVAYKIWFCIICLQNILFGLYLWLCDTTTFRSIFPALLLSSLIEYSALIFVLYRINARKRQGIKEYMESPEIAQETDIAQQFNKQEFEIVHQIGELLGGKNQQLQKQQKD